jgi:hypothetical protein
MMRGMIEGQGMRKGGERGGRKGVELDEDEVGGEVERLGLPTDRLRWEKRCGRVGNSDPKED